MGDSLITGAPTAGEICAVRSPRGLLSASSARNRIHSPNLFNSSMKVRMGIPWSPVPLSRVFSLVFRHIDPSSSDREEQPEPPQSLTRVFQEEATYSSPTLAGVRSPVTIRSP